MSKIKPIGDLVLLKFEKQTKTDAGIILSDQDSPDMPDQAEVVSVGPDVKLKLSEGDIVLIRTFGWQEVVRDEIKYLIGKEECVLGLIS